MELELSHVPELGGLIVVNVNVGEGATFHIEVPDCEDFPGDTKALARRIVAGVNHADALAAALRLMMGAADWDGEDIVTLNVTEIQVALPQMREALRAYDAAKAAPDAGSSEGGTR